MTTTVKTIPSHYNYQHASQWLEVKGQEEYGSQFRLQEEDTSIIYKYSRASLQPHAPHTYCFDDLGMENNIKYFGNDCNVMAEILLTRYDLYTSHHIITHLTTNLSAGEIEQAYGTRVRSRCREMFNLIAFDNNTPDKRK